MQWVEVAAARPHHCAFLTFIGNSNAVGGFIDTGVELAGYDNHIYCSAIAAKQFGEMVGMVDRDAHKALADDLERTLVVLEAAQAERDELKAKFAAIDVLASEGFRARNKPGRPKKTEVVA